MEILQQSRTVPTAIFVPVGGGGLISGIAAYVKAVMPQIKVVGVECEDSACLHAALAAKERVTLQEVGIFADGVAVKRVGQHTFDIAKRLVDEVVTVSVDQICAAIRDVFEDTRTLAEPAGALALAGLKKYAATAPTAPQQWIAIHSGANVNFDRLGHVVERAQLGDEAEALLGVTIPERPGSFLRFCRDLEHQAVTEFNYRFADPNRAEVFVGLRTTAPEKHRVIQRLSDSGHEVLDLSDNELAKLHVRHLVGGVAAGLEFELLYRFEFPERPGALLEFLTKLAGRWNISLFHYRNHGAAFGRVLAGFRVPPAERNQFQQFLAELGYHAVEESNNPAYSRFLQAHAVPRTMAAVGS